MDREPEELQFLGLAGIITESIGIVVNPRQRRVFSQITLALILPLSLLFLVHIHISHLLFHRIHSDEVALDNSPPNSASSASILADLSDEWALFLLFKAIYLLALLVFSLLSTSAVVYSVAALFTAKPLSSDDPDAHFHKLLFTVVPRVWRRLMLTFLWAFLVLVAYHVASAFVFVLLILVLGTGALALLLLSIVAAAYLAGLVWISVVWHLASVITVLEDSYGIPAMTKSRQLIRGKTRLACFIFLLLNLVFILLELGFKKLVVQHRGYGLLGRLGLGFVFWALLVAVILLALVVQTVMYFICKSYHHESIDKASLADHLEVYMGEYVPLKERDVQMEHFYGGA